MRGEAFGSLRHYRDQTRKITSIAVLQLASAYCQTMALVLVIPLVKNVANSVDEFEGKIGPLHISASTGQLAILATGSIIAAGIFDVWTSSARSRAMAKWEYARREKVIGEYLATDYATQAAERLGTLGTLTTYVNRGSVALGSLMNALGSALTIVIFLVVAMLIDYRAAIFLIITIVLLSYVLRPLMKRTKKYSRALSAILVSYGQDVTEATRMARDVRVFQAHKAIGDQLTDMSQQVSTLRQKSNFISGITSPAYQYLGMLLVIGALGASTQLPHMNLTEFGAIALLLLRSMSNGSSLQNAYQSYLDSSPYLEKLEEMRAVYVSRATPDGGVILEEVHGLELDDVRFSYDGEVDALAGVSASFRVGEIVGIVGPSGGGKSTLSQLILRLREPTAGDIRVNGMAAGEYTLASWYRHVSLVPQDPRLLHATVWENIAFLDDSISRDDVVAAAKAAGVHEVIEALDNGYDTLIGPAFRDLSGGQIQRIGIARALARGAQVLVLDEPTSALDMHSESVIQNTLESLGGSVLVLIIAHRLTTLSICDRILVLKQGAIETMGTLEDVTERSEFFRRALDAGTLEVNVTDRPPNETIPEH
jgi:ATP-binding cassette subfamily B protein